MVTVWINRKPCDLSLIPACSDLLSAIVPNILPSVFPLIHPQHKPLADDPQAYLTMGGINHSNSPLLCSNITTTITTATMARHLAIYH